MSANIPFDTADKISADKYLELRQKAFARAKANMVKTGDPHKEPPSIPPLNRNPRKHDVVAWRNDGLRLDTTRHDTKEAAIEYALALPWVIYFRYAVMDGRNLVQAAPIPIPEGMALDDNGMPIKV